MFYIFPLVSDCFVCARKSTNASRAYEMRWASPEDFSELKVMPRMLLDHLPDNIQRTLTAVIDQQKVDAESASSPNADADEDAAV